VRLDLENIMNREQKLAAFTQLTKIPGIKKASTVFADSRNGVRLLFEHPHSGLPWKVLGRASDPGFWYLESAVPIGFDYEEERLDYQRFELVVHESSFSMDVQ
jgi:hypothetical protein